MQSQLIVQCAWHAMVAQQVGMPVQLRGKYSNCLASGKGVWQLQSEAGRFRVPSRRSGPYPRSQSESAMHPLSLSKTENVRAGFSFMTLALGTVSALSSGARFRATPSPTQKRPISQITPRITSHQEQMSTERILQPWSKDPGVKLFDSVFSSGK